MLESVFAVIYSCPNSSLLFHHVCSEDNVTQVDGNRSKCNKSYRWQNREASPGQRTSRLTAVKLDVKLIAKHKDGIKKVYAVIRSSRGKNRPNIREHAAEIPNIYNT